MTARDEKYREKYLMAVQPHVEGEARAVGLFSRPGSMNAAVLSQVSGLAAGIGSWGAKKKAGGLPLNVVVAATDEQVYVFDFKPRGTGIKIKETVAIWPRGRVRVTPTQQGMLADRLVVEIGEGQVIELDSNKMPGFASDFNGPLIQMLGAPPA
ncbi:MAG: hypothetical protein KDB35_23905 [Acidimicrobiales bacterium]|nr:hypothetical protein [Acidimicrobiales bacterium]MCB1017892.1 hypothetical protein [Acidimicrobiales bacterium]